ncbi:MAG: S1/P1 Nuclease [Bacteroidetes bacterium]|nr:S1/P1 Nuclease [Bacteroidota bacterium]
MAKNEAKAWGFYGHKLCNRNAVFSLPPQMFGFYKNYIDYITEHSIDPDSRRYIVAEEACRHYLDADHYEKAAPFDTIPHYWKDASFKYTVDTLNAHGIVPWHVFVMYYRLKDAFEKKDLAKILKTSSDIGHYVADAHVPLHSTSNYNGQKTGQNGIHGLWESRVLELFSSEYDLFCGRATYINNVQEYMWLTAGDSYNAVDSVLLFERLATKHFGDDGKYTFEQRGTQTIRTYSQEFCRKYHDMLGDQVERRIRASILSISSIWYTAWVDAGMPDLDGLITNEPIKPEDKPTENVPEKMIGRQEEE